MVIDGRQVEIVRALKGSESVSVADLARDLNTSEVTIRRDLAELETAGVLRRVRGGAVSAVLRGDELPFVLREMEGVAEKARIASAAVNLIADGEAVLLDSGTTGLAAAHELSSRNVTVMPLAAHAIPVLMEAATVRLLLPGGTVRSGETSVVGPMVEQNLATLRFDTVLLTCCGLSRTSGVTAYDMQDAAVKRAALTSSTRVIAVADSSKFTRTALAVVCALDRIDVLVTDVGAPQDVVAELRDEGIQVLCV
ncbi:DeoR/GlpR family DNA-binding transcription regulator [Rhodococcus sp. NPDC056516]|uniref:DeoR/GlpR family DNA-binding transcription regulator n=1 Tax=Rhodococcus sp. NPDC056516 TaxID=3345847 RepID=UPI00366AB970